MSFPVEFNWNLGIDYDSAELSLGLVVKDICWVGNYKKAPTQVNFMAITKQRGSTTVAELVHRDKHSVGMALRNQVMHTAVTKLIIVVRTSYTE